MSKNIVREWGVRVKQYIALWCVVLIIVVVTFVFFDFRAEQKGAPPQASEGPPQLLSAEEVWGAKILDRIERIVQPLELKIKDLQSKVEESEERFIKETRALEEELIALNMKDEKSEDPLMGALSEAKVTVYKAKAGKSKKLKVPAGAFVEALILSGVDAKASVGAQSDPQPVLFMTRGKITLPGFESRGEITHCHVVGSAYGDLSSERVYMRLESMSCQHSNGDSSESKVAGYVVGQDGRVGIRGRMAIRDVRLLARGAWGGVLSGLAHMMSRPAPVLLAANSGGHVEGRVSYNNMFQQGMNKSGTSALDRLSNYYIERAEQLQPVIQIDSGQSVALVFTKNTTFGEDKVHEQMDYERERARQDALNAAMFTGAESLPPPIAD